MFISNLNVLPKGIFSYSRPSFETLTSDLTGRVKQIATLAFEKLSTFFNSYDNQPNEGNVKTFALFSFSCLILLLFISIFRKRESSIVPPPTPYPKQKIDSQEE